MAKKPIEEETAEKTKAKKEGTETVVEKVDKAETVVQQKKLSKKYGKVMTLDLKQRDPFIPRAVEQKLRIDILKMRAITPNELAQKYDIRVSTMRHFLDRLVNEGLLVTNKTSRRVKVFNPKQ